MKLKVKEKIINIEESVIIVLFVCLFSKIARRYLESYYLCFLFIAFHELSHIFIATLFGVNLRGINIGLSGLSACLEKNNSSLKAVIIYLAGPLSNIILAIMFSNIDIIFEINLVLALINLIPMKPLDGYNILSILLSKRFNKNIKRKILKIISIVVQITMFFLGIVLAAICCNISLILMLLYIKIENLNPVK